LEKANQNFDLNLILPSLLENVEFVQLSALSIKSLEYSSLHVQLDLLLESFELVGPFSPLTKSLLHACLHRCLD
jgi:hypothetical protein